MQIPQLEKLQDLSSLNFKIKEALRSAINEVYSLDIDFRDIEVNKTQDSKFGDLTTNIALKIGKQVGSNPREIGEKLKSYFDEKPLAEVANIEIAGPGFVNFFLSNQQLISNLSEVLKQRENYGKWDVGVGKVMVEFGQPNTHKAFHIGHLKSAITGLGLVKLFQVLGYDVIQANFFGDVGMHVAKCIWGFLNKSEDEDFKTAINSETDPHKRMKMLDECYVLGAKKFKEDSEIERQIREINKSVYSKDDNQINEVYALTREWSINHLSSIFNELGVNYDRQYPESEVYPLGLKRVRENIGKIFIEDDGAIIFPGKEYGVDNWVFITSEGNPTYSAKDYGLATKKFEEFEDLFLSVYTTSVEQMAYFKGVFKALELTDEKFQGKLFHIPFGWMLREDKKKFSSRMGESIKGMDVIQEANDLALQKISESKKYDAELAREIARKVSLAGLKFLILSHEVHKDLSYDPEEFLNPEGFSGPYVLYSYVRAKSILRQADEKSEITFNGFSNFNSDEATLLKMLQQYPQVTFQAGKTLSPHLIAFYLFELAQSFNKFYKENKVLVEDEMTKAFRLNLVEAVSIVLQNGLDLLGIETIEQM